MGHAVPVSMDNSVRKLMDTVQMDVRQIINNRCVKTVLLVSMETTARKSVGNVKMSQAAIGLPVCVQMAAKNTGYHHCAKNVNSINTVLTVRLTVDIVRTTNRVLWTQGTVQVDAWKDGWGSTASQLSPALTNKELKNLGFLL